MIVKKTFEVSAKDIDSVVLELAEEIKKGWTITRITRLDCEFKMYIREDWWPTFEVTLQRKEAMW